jgi:hypothetical protein
MWEILVQEALEIVGLWEIKLIEGAKEYELDTVFQY